MTARAGLTVVGQAVGAYFGGPVGAAIGGAVGGMLGGALEGPQRTQQALLEDLGAIKFDYGSPWPRIYGAYRVKIAPLWSSEKRPVAHDEEVDSKGGPDQINRTFTYVQDWLCGGPINATGWLRIFINGKLRASQRFDADDDTIEASAATPAWAAVEFFDGASDQLPWPVYEAAVGSADACAYRHRPTIAFTSLDLGTSGQPPLIEVEFVTDTSEDETGFLEDFETSYPDEWTITGGDAFALAAGPWGNCMTVAGGAITAFGSSLVRAVDTGGPITGVTFKFRMDEPFVLGDNTDDAPVLELQDAGTNRLFAFWGAREWFYDVNQRPAVAFGVASEVLLPTTFTLPTGVWFRATLRITEENSCLVTIANESTGEIIASQACSMSGSSWTPGFLRIYDSWSYGGSNSKPGGSFDQIQLGLPATRLTPLSVPLSEIVLAEETLSWSGEAGALAAADIDVSELEETLVTGWLTTGSPREGVAQLMGDWYFGLTCSDKLYHRLRGAASIGTVAADDTGAGVGGAGEIFAGLERGNDLEVAMQVAVTGPNVLTDYEPGTEMSDRLVGESVELRSYATASVFTPAERKGRADTMVLDGRVASHTGQVALDDRHVEKEPFDVWVQTDDEGNTYRVRAERETYADGVRTFDVVLDDPTVLSFIGITAETDRRAITLTPAADTEALLIDAPMLRDADDARGFYGLGKPAEARRWTGYTLFKSADGTNYTGVASGSKAGVFGTCSVVPGAGRGARLFDEAGAIVVDVGAGTLTSSTREAILNDTAVNAFFIGAHGRWLFGQFRSAELIGEGEYRLTGLLLGGFGTEQHIGTQEVGDTFALARYSDGLIRVPTDAIDQDAARYYKPVSVGQTLGAATTQSFTEAEVGKKPYSPVDLRAARLAGDITLRAQRRTRLQVRMTGAAGILVPLGEASEAYVAEVFADDTFATVVRTITGWSSVDDQHISFAYTAAEQTTDFGSPQASVSFAVYQLSAAVGRGFAAQATL